MTDEQQLREKFDELVGKVASHNKVAMEQLCDLCAEYSDAKFNEVHYLVHKVLQDDNLELGTHALTIKNLWELCEKHHAKSTAELIAENKELKTMLNERRIEAARLGYMAGHDDTVESRYGDPDEVARDLCQDLDDER